MGFKKFFCTCVGCVVGAACIALTGGAATPLVATALIGGAGTAGYFIGDKQEKDEKKLKNQEKELANQTKAIEELRQENQKTRTDETEWKKKYKEKEAEEKKKEQEIKEIENKLNNPNLSDEEKSSLKRKLITSQQDLSKIKGEKKSILEIVKELQDKINNNNKTISSITSNSSGKKKDIWEFITLENILIVVAAYALWQIVRDNNRRY